jgi:hypothetical protein
MQARLKVFRRLILTIAIAAVMPAAAQVSSKAGQITIVASMPEALKLSFNTNDSLQLTGTLNPNENPLIAATVKTAWWLAPGRAQVSTSTYIKYPAAPVLIALATSPTSMTRTGRSFVGNLSYEFRVPKPVSAISISQIKSMTIMEGKLVSASTTSLSSANSLTNHLPSDTSQGTLTIQVQPIL